MKKVIAFIAILVLLMGLAACGKETETRYLESTVVQEYIGAVTFHREYDYDKEGRMISSVVTDGQLESLVKYSYTDHSVLMEITQNGETGTMKQVFERDESGNIVHVETFEDDVLVYISDSTFDENGNMLVNVQETVATGSVFTTTYTYDENGNRVKVVYDYGSGGTVTENTYDESGQLLSSTESDLSGTLKTREEHSRNEDGTELVSHYDAQGQLTATDHITYDEAGNMILCESYDTEGELVYRATYTYIKIEVPVE